MGHSHEDIKLENHLAMTEAEYKHHKSDVWKTTAILSAVTIGEVAFAIIFDKYLHWPQFIYALVIIVLSIFKAAYIMAVFMHVKHETKSLILTITLPFTLLIWMIIAFMMDGQSWNDFNQGRFIKKEYNGKPHPAVQKQHSGVVKEENHH